MCKYCEMEKTDISDCNGAIFDGFWSQHGSKVCIIHGNILSSNLSEYEEIFFCPKCGELLKPVEE